jgi:hypothetical protein
MATTTIAAVAVAVMVTAMVTVKLVVRWMRRRGVRGG